MFKFVILFLAIAFVAAAPKPEPEAKPEAKPDVLVVEEPLATTFAAGNLVYSSPYVSASYVASPYAYPYYAASPYAYAAAPLYFR